MEKNQNFTCADCLTKACYHHEMDKLPEKCPTRRCPENENLKFYTDEEMEIARAAARVEADGYGKLTRLEEIMAFSYRMGYRKLGVAFCVGFKNEAKILVNILRENGFEVEAIMCKCGSVSKEVLGIDKAHQVRTVDYEPMCNPAGQGEHLNAARTELNIILGLCVGHDTIFIKHSKAPVTAFVCKDRVLAHNPVGVLYQSDEYLRRVHTFIKDNFNNEADKA